MCVCVYVSVCETDREIERESGGREDAERPAEQIFLHAWSGSWERGVVEQGTEAPGPAAAQRLLLLTAW